MSQLTRILFGMVFYTTTNALLLRQIMDDKRDSMQAKCIDGSAALFYIRRGVGNDANNWILFLQGGGWCIDESDCYDRSKTHLGSNTGHGPNETLSGLLEENCKYNPTFCNYNHVQFVSCDGNSFSGNTQMHFNGTTLYSYGKNIIDATLTTLIEKFDLGKAQNVLVSGCSAGGLAAYLHADYIHDYIKPRIPTLQKYAVAPQSGFFLNHENVVGEYAYGEQFQYIWKMTNPSSSVNQGCLAAHAGEEWKCNMAQYTYPHIKSRIFVMNSAIDEWHTRCILGGTLPPGFPRNTTSSSPWRQVGNGMCNSFDDLTPCLEHPQSHCGVDGIGMINSYISDFMRIIESAGTFTKTGNGAFIHSCHTHCAELGNFFWIVRVRQVTMQAAVASWWNGPLNASSEINTYTPCLMKAWQDVIDRRCNPTCPNDA